MATSFADQIPTILYAVQMLKPRRVLDIGKGFGKYGFLIHEYCGIDVTKKPSPDQMMKTQSLVKIDCVDVNPDYSFPHLEHFYDKMLLRDVSSEFEDLGDYDLVLMVDVIEHLEKDAAHRLLDFFLGKGAKI